MPGRSLAVCFAVVMIISADGAAWARSERSSNGGSSHERSGKPSSGYISRTCKTQACFKKHPSGHYSAPVGKKHKKD